MSIISILMLFALIMPAVSYAWGMRGTTIGGEKGAMLPGATIGTILALCSNIFIVQENFYIFASLGAVAMYLGGCMTYGETLSLSMDAYPAVNKSKGLIALALKGFLWFAVFGAVFTTGISAITHKYSIIELLNIFISTPLSALLGLRLFNRPHSTDELIYPKIYFSKKRKEYWGALLGIAFTLLIINTIKLNWYSVIFTLICGVFGAVGWVIGQCLQIYLIHKAKKSSYKIIRRCVEKQYFDSWKAMECTLGAIGGLGCAVAFIATYKDFKASMLFLEINGGLAPQNQSIIKGVFVIWLVLLAIDMLHYYIKKPLSITELKELYIAGKITQEKYTRLIFKAVPKVDKLPTKVTNLLEAYEFVVYAAIPFILIALGSKQTAQAMAFFMMYWVLAQEIGFEKNFCKIPLSILGVVLFIIQIPLGIDFGAKSTIVLYTIIYEVLSFVLIVKEILSQSSVEIQLNKSVKIIDEIKLVLKNKSFLTTHIYFVVCIITVLAIL